MILSTVVLLFFFFQAEDGIRDVAVTGVQTCALPIYPVTADQIVQEQDANRIRSARRLAGHAKASARRTGRHAVPRDRVVDHEHVVVARHADSVPAVVVDGVVDDGVRSAVGIEGGDAVAAVRVDQAVHDQGTGVASRDRDTAVALRRSVAEDPQPLEDDGQILVVAAHEGNGGATASGDRQAANRDELRLLEADGMTVRTRCDGTSEHDAPDGRDRKSTRLNSSHGYISYAVFCLKKKK